jgi:long-chain fatty acid transport protein
MKMKYRNKIMMLSVSAALGAAVVPATVWAGGFGIGTQSGSGMGNAYAGGAAAAEDASVLWSNPAGMTALPTGMQVTGALYAIKPSFKFGNAGSTVTFAPPGTGDGGDGGGWAFVPNGFFAMSITPALRVGVALNAPFGLKTEYDPGWRGALTGLTSEIKTVNIQPSIAYKVNDQFSIGAGVSVQKIDASLSNSAGALGIAKLEADDWGYGFNLGVTFQPAASTRIGAHYRSSVKYNLEGTATFSGFPAANTPVMADLKTPDSFSLSMTHALNSDWELMGDVTWTGWSNVQKLIVVRSNGTTLQTLDFLWKDTWRYGVGANYKFSNQTKLRLGLARDNTPTNDATRTPRLPDQDRTWVALGIQYKPSKQGTLEFGYVHEFVKDAAVNVPVPGFATCVAGCLTGSFKNKADIFSIQYSHLF